MNQSLDVQQFLLAVDLKTTDYTVTYTWPDAAIGEWLDLTTTTPIIAQDPTTEETSAALWQNVTNAWDGFYQSGQIWALLVGLVLGYGIRSLTAY